MTPYRPPSPEELKRNVLEDEHRIASFDEKLEIRMLRITDDHETRIRDMEKWQWRHTGILLIVTGVATWLITDDIQTLRRQMLIPQAATTVRR